MKRKVIFGLIVSMLFSFTLNVQAVEVKEGINKNVSTVESIDNTDYSEVAKSIKQNAEILTNKLGDTSVQYAISEGDKIVVSDNVGVYSKTENRALTKDTMYGIGSVSKVFTTAAVMKLVDDGKIDLDLPLINYIKDFEMADPRYVKITPRMLLNHSAGFIGTTIGNAALYDDNDTRTFDNLLAIKIEE